MKVELHPDDVDTYSTDSRGRLNLGTDYANSEVEIAILDDGAVDVTQVTVTTVVPYTDGGKYRDYELAAGEVAAFLADLADDSHAERVVAVDVQRE